MNIYNADHERFLFLKRFFENPRRVGSITQSSEFLARGMVRKEEVESCRNIIELGAGMGVFTKIIDNYKSPSCTFHIFEKDATFTEYLKIKFPHLQFHSEAGDIEKLIRNGSIESPELIISGLPFAVFDSELRNRILDGVYESLKKGGKFITYQYSFDLLSDLKKRYKMVKLDFALFNVPPAIIYKCIK